MALFSCLTDICKNTPEFLILHSPKSTTGSGGEPSSDELIPAGSYNDRCSRAADTKLDPLIISPHSILLTGLQIIRSTETAQTIG